MHADVLIIGGGPVGLTLACLLGTEGLQVVVAERRQGPSPHSMAIGITPPTLAILRRLGLDDTFAASGVCIRQARVHENMELLGTLGFAQLPAAHRYILSLPQSQTVALLRGQVARLGAVTVRDGLEFESYTQDASGVTAVLRNHQGGPPEALRARLLVGCDGHESLVRQAMGSTFRGRQHAPQFVMADFADDTELGDDAALFFGREASVESFPLPGARRRWVLLATPSQGELSLQTLVGRVQGLTGHALRPETASGLSPFRTRSMVASRFVQGRVVLCGDAAHVMSPIGGQGMNTGIGDAELLAAIVARADFDPDRMAAGLCRYARFRRHAFRIAARRAELGMWLGTRSGAAASRMRAHVIRHLLRRPGLQDEVARWFAMLSLPANRLA